MNSKERSLLLLNHDLFSFRAPLFRVNVIDVGSRVQLMGRQYQVSGGFSNGPAHELLTFDIKKLQGSVMYPIRKLYRDMNLAARWIWKWVIKVRGG